jgi:hypothetical protein
MGCRWRLLAGLSLEPVTQRAVVTAFEAPFLALALPGFDQVLKTTRTLDRRFTALGAPMVALHAQLVLPLPRNPQVRELIFNPFSHIIPFRPLK